MSQPNLLKGLRKSSSAPSSQTTSSFREPWWISQEDDVHVKTIMQRFCLMLDVKPQKAKNSRAPPSFIAQIQRTRVQPSFQLKRDHETISYAQKLSHQRSASISLPPRPRSSGSFSPLLRAASFLLEPNTTMQDSSSSSGPRVRTLDEITICQRDMVPIGFEMPRVEMAEVLTTWDDDGLPQSIQILRKKDVKECSRYLVGDPLSVLCCLPVFPWEGEYRYFSQPQALKSLGYWNLEAQCVVNDLHFSDSAAAALSSLEDNFCEPVQNRASAALEEEEDRHHNQNGGPHEPQNGTGDGHSGPTSTATTTTWGPVDQETTPTKKGKKKKKKGHHHHHEEDGSGSDEEEPRVGMSVGGAFVFFGVSGKGHMGSRPPLPTSFDTEDFDFFDHGGQGGSKNGTVVTGTRDEAGAGAGDEWTEDDLQQEVSSSSSSGDESEAGETESEEASDTEPGKSENGHTAELDESQGEGDSDSSSGEEDEEDLLAQFATPIFSITCIHTKTMSSPKR